MTTMNEPSTPPSSLRNDTHHELPAPPMPSTTALSDGSSSPKKRPPKKLSPSLQAFSDMAMAAMLKNLNRPGDH